MKGLGRRQPWKCAEDIRNEFGAIVAVLQAVVTGNEVDAQQMKIQKAKAETLLAKIKNLLVYLVQFRYIHDMFSFLFDASLS